MPSILKSPSAGSNSFENRRKQSLGLAALRSDPFAFADLLHPLEGATESVIELLQEATERFLKAYLLSRGWKLRKIHDLGALVAEAVDRDPRFATFEDFADSLTDQFWAQHYPGGDLDELGHDYPALRQSLEQMVQLIESEIAPRS